MDARSVGSDAERQAAAFLESQGYKILHRNYTCARGEIDLIAEDQGVLCFIEVRYRRRSRFGTPSETIGPEKRQRIILTARYFLLRHGLEERECRFDVVAIQEGSSPELLRDAFED